MRVQFPQMQARKRVRGSTLGLAIAVCLIVAILATFLLDRAASRTAETGSMAAVDLPIGEPALVTEAQLVDLGREVGNVYWVGPRRDASYELTRASDGSVAIRYLPLGKLAGQMGDYLTVVTTALKDGYEQLRLAATPGADSLSTASGALVLADTARPNSVHFSFERAEFQVEVFSPTVGESRRLVLDGSAVLLSHERKKHKS